MRSPTVLQDMSSIMDKEQLLNLTTTANKLIADEYSLWNPSGDAPQITPAILKIVMQVIQGDDTRTDVRDEVKVVAKSRKPKSKQLGFSQPELDAIKHRLREIAINGLMPTQSTWDKKRGDLISVRGILHRGVSWRNLADMTGLEYAGPTRETEAAATERAAKFHRQDDLAYSSHRA